MSNKLKSKKKNYGIKSFAKETVNNFNNWMSASNFSLDTLKTICAEEISSFEMEITRQVSGVYAVAVFYKTKKNPFAEQMLGLPFIAPSKEEQTEKLFLLDAFTVIVYLSKVMDSFSSAENSFCYDSVIRFGKTNAVMSKIIKLEGL